MKGTQLRYGFVATLACLFMASSGPGATAAAERPDFSGDWKLNQEQSENPIEKMMEAMQNRSGGGGRDGGMRGGGRGGGMRGGGGKSGGWPSGGGDMGGGRQGDTGSERGSGRRSLMDLGEDLEALSIVHREESLSVTNASGHERDFRLDGNRVRLETARGTAEVKAKWKSGKRVEITTETEKGLKLKETYKLDLENRQLVVTTRTEGGRLPGVSVRRVYDAVAENDADLDASGSDSTDTQGS